MTNPDALIQRCSEMAAYIRKLNRTLEDCSRKAISGQFLFRPVYHDEYLRLAAQAKEDERLYMEGARALVILLDKAQKADTVTFSQAQSLAMFDYLEALKKPLFPALNGAEYRIPGLNVQVRKDC